LVVRWLGHWVHGALNPDIHCPVFRAVGLSALWSNNSIISGQTSIRQQTSGAWALRGFETRPSVQRLRAVLLTSIDDPSGGCCPLLFETSLQAQFPDPHGHLHRLRLGFPRTTVLVVIPALMSYLKFPGKKAASTTQAG